MNSYGIDTDAVANLNIFDNIDNVGLGSFSEEQVSYASILCLACVVACNKWHIISPINKTENELAQIKYILDKDSVTNPLLDEELYLWCSAYVVGAINAVRKRTTSMFQHIAYGVMFVITWEITMNIIGS